MITKLAENEIFVFGSNYAGRHGKGAALTAYRKFGAIQGQGTGLMGRCYGIATKDRNFKVLPLRTIELQIARFLKFARLNTFYTFLVTPIGCGLAGYKYKEIAPLFINNGVPENVILPDEFKQWVKENEG